MYTRKDVAREAGVSQATVSNVLNGKGNVSLEKIRLVTEAAQRLGYSINAQARQLRRDTKVSDIVAILIPTLENIEFTMLYSAINNKLDGTGFRPALFITGGSPAQERDLVQSLAAMRVAGVITVSSLHEDPDIYSSITNYGGHVVHVLCQPKFAADFIGFDFEQAGRQIAAAVHSQNPSQILILSGLNTIQMENQFVDSITQALKETIPLSVLHASNDTASQIVLQHLGRAPFPDTLITSNEALLEQAKIALNLYGVSNRVKCFSLAPRKILQKDSSANLFLFDYYELGVRAAERILFCIQNTEDISPVQKTLPPVGFQHIKTLKRSNTAVTLRVLMMKGQCSSAIMSMTPSFSRQTNISVSYTTLSPYEMDELYSHPEILQSFDIFRIGSSRLPYFPKRHLLALDQDLHADLTEGMAPSLVQLLSVVNATPYGVPFDVGTQVMVYRKDLFGDAMLKRMYYEACGNNLEVPQDFNSYLQICRFFDQRKNPLSPVTCGTSGSFGTDAEIFAEFYDRYQSAASMPLMQDAVINFDCQAAKWAIENYIETIKSSSFVLDGQYYGSNLQSFSAGKTAMEQIAVNYSSNIIHLRGTNVDSKIGYADVPGRYPALGGGVLSINKSCREPEAALAYIRWACGMDSSELYTYLGGVSPFMHVYTNQEILFLYPWYRLIPPKFQKPATHLWDKFHAGKLEHLVGYLLRNVCHGILSSEQAVEALQQKISDCMLSDHDNY